MVPWPTTTALAAGTSWAGEHGAARQLGLRDRKALPHLRDGECSHGPGRGRLGHVQPCPAPALGKEDSQCLV